jgi:hypothetical protein
VAGRHKLKIYSTMMDGVRRWYVSCRGCGSDNFVPMGADGYYGRRTFDLVLAIGIVHQKEEQDAQRAGMA